VARAVSAGIKQDDVEVAITLYLHEKHLVQKDGFVHIRAGRDSYAMPKAQVAANANDRFPAHQRPQMQPINQATKDVIQRREDGRPAAAEPLPAFESRLEQLGHCRFGCLRDHADHENVLLKNGAARARW
jgi:hypothetical protein